MDVKGPIASLSKNIGG